MKKDFRDSALLFYVVFGFWYLMDIILRTQLEEKINLALGRFFDITSPDINSYVDVAVLALLLIQIILFQRYSVKEFILIVLITVPIIYATFNCNINYLISIMLFVVAAQNASMDRTIRIAYSILCISIPIIILMCVAGILPDYTIYRGAIIRHSLGFEHPNRLGMRLFQLAACHCYVHRKSNRRFFTYLVLILFTIFIYYVPNSQTAYICMGILLVLYILGHIIDRYNLNALAIMKMLFVLAAIINIGTVFLCFISPKSNRIYDSIDKFMSRRFYWCNRMYQYYGVTWFGQKISTIVQDTKYAGIYHQWYLDNAYFSILLTFGIIVYVIFTVLYLAAIYHFINENNFMMVSILTLYAVYGIMTTGFYQMSHNIFVLAISSALYAKEDSEMEEIHKKKVQFVLGLKSPRSAGYHPTT